MGLPSKYVRSCFRDMMHIVFLGTAKDLLGSCIKLLLRGNAAQKELQLGVLTEELHSWCKTTGLKIRRRLLTLANVGLDKAAYAELGSVFKASHTKAMLFFICSKMIAKQTEILHGPLVAFTVWSLAKATYIFDNAGLIMDAGEASEASNLLQLHLRAWQHLSHLYKDERIFYLRPKHHYLAHLATDLEAHRLNPKCFACYDDESYLSRVKRLCVQVHARQAPLRTIQRYLIFLGLRFHESRCRAGED